MNSYICGILLRLALAIRYLWGFDPSSLNAGKEAKEAQSRREHTEDVTTAREGNFQIWPTSIPSLTVLYEKETPGAVMEA
ncbi:hypothetical protein ABHI18_005219 [Aspergillus niger]